MVMSLQTRLSAEAKSHQCRVENAWPLAPIDPGTVVVVRGIRLSRAVMFCALREIAPTWIKHEVKT